jgi:hypothetical protein
MRTFLIVFRSLLLGKLLPAQTIIETPAQTITNQYVTISSATEAEKTAIKKAVYELEQAGIYNKLFSLNIGKFFKDSRCYNLIVPLDYDGAFTLSVKAGSPSETSEGIRLGDGDSLSTHFMNHLPSNAPEIGMFWYTDVGVNKGIIASLSPFNIEPCFEGKAYVNIWNTADGIPVPPTPAGFCLAQRIDASTVEFYQGTTKFSEALPINSPNPVGNETIICGNSDGAYVLKVFGITEALTESQVSDLKKIIDQLVIDLNL